MKSKRIRKMSKRYRNNKKNKTCKKRKHIKKYKGGHENEDLPHYHLIIKFPSGQYREVPEQFLHTVKGRVGSATVRDIEQYVTDIIGNEKSVSLFWKGKRLNPETKLRKIIVDDTKIEPYKPNIDDPIIVRYNDEIGIDEHPEWFEDAGIDYADPDTREGTPEEPQNP